MLKTVTAEAAIFRLGTAGVTLFYNVGSCFIAIRDLTNPLRLQTTFWVLFQAQFAKESTAGRVAVLELLLALPNGNCEIAC